MSDLGACWQPLIPLRFIERDGKRVLQQAWGEIVLGYGRDGGHEWHQSDKHEWRDVPLLPEGPTDPKFWVTRK